MDESTWTICPDPESMREFLGEAASGRKLRLFAAACGRRVWQLLDKNARKAVVAAERFADGRIGLDELRQAASRAQRGSARRKWWSLQDDRTAYARRAAYSAADEGDKTTEAARQAAAACSVLAIEDAGDGRAIVWGGGGYGPRLRWSRRGYGKADRDHRRLREQRVEDRKQDAWGAERMAQADLLRCIFSPFRPVAAHPAWLTPLVASLAEAAYDERELPSGELDSLRLAMLADALEEAGCTDAGVLGHLHRQGPHVRGCFAVDAALGRV